MVPPRSIPAAWFTLTLLLVAALTGCTGPAAGSQPPAASREFRAVWVATVGNIDWPSKPGLDADMQRREAIAILDRAAQLHLNAVILQVRPSCDALYASDLEPWSEFLTGQQGRAPEPAYDPLRLWVEEAHRRAIELHAWINPFRARTPKPIGEAAATHISRTRPDLVRSYGGYLWLDPGEPEAREQTLRVILDVVRRYDIDGVHMDDYFYPYPVKGQDFPDEPSWQRYRESGGTVARADWRRANIDGLVRDLYRRVKREKPWVKVGISPFGIWRPGYPASVKGFDAFDGLSADSRRWLREGWCDYFTPQLYWRLDAPAQPYGDLLAWWASQNIRGRHLWPGNYTGRVTGQPQGWPAQEVLEQIAHTRGMLPADHGNVHFSMAVLMKNRGDVATALQRGPYPEPALVPASPWLHRTPPAPPAFRADRDSSGPLGTLRVSWEPRWPNEAQLCTVYARHGGLWRLHVFPAGQQTCVLLPDPAAGAIEAVAVRVVDRFGNESAPGAIAVVSTDSP